MNAPTGCDPSDRTVRRAYYVLPDGRRDPLSELLDCVNCFLYFELDSLDDEPPNPYRIFLDDTTLTVLVDDRGRISDIDIHARDRHPHVFEMETIEARRGDQWWRRLHRLLVSGRRVLIDTSAEHVPFLAQFGSTRAVWDRTKHGPHHQFLFVGGSESEYHYVEYPYNINRDLFVPHPLNSEVGVASAEHLREAFDAFLYFSTVTIHRDNLRALASVDCVRDRMLALCERFAAVPETSRGDRRLQGRAAIAAIHHALINGDARALGRDDSLREERYGGFFKNFGWVVLELTAKKRILAGALMSMDSDPASAFARTAFEVDSNIALWRRLLVTVQKAARHGDSASLRRAIASDLTAAAASEERIVELLRVIAAPQSESRASRAE